MRDADQAARINRWLLRFGALLAVGLVGCGGSETPGPERSVADASSPDRVANLPDEPTPAQPATQRATEPEVPAASAPAPPPEGLPWKTAESTPPPEAAADLFGGISANASPPARVPASEAKPEPKADLADDIDSFLLGAYGGADSGGQPESAGESPAPGTPESENLVAQSVPPEPSLPALPETPSLARLKPEDLEDLPPITPLPELPAAPIAATPNPQFDALLSEPPPKPAAKRPTTTAPASADDLWADAPPAETGPDNPTPSEPKPEPVVPELPPLDLPPKPALSAVAEAPPELPEPEPVLPDSAPQVAEPESPPRVASRAPLASDAIDPLPRLPVLSYNTRHLTWLLGAKLALAGLADMDGATPAEIATWTDETERLAAQLKVEVASPDRSSDSTAERVQRLLAQAGPLSTDLARRHGDDHAALLEIAVKTNALLVLAAERPDLAEPVGRSVGNAAERALLPRFLWEDAVQSLNKDASPEAIQEAAVRLHQRVEPFLR